MVSFSGNDSIKLHFEGFESLSGYSSLRNSSTSPSIGISQHDSLPWNFLSSPYSLNNNKKKNKKGKDPSSSDRQSKDVPLPSKQELIKWYNYRERYHYQKLFDYF